MGLPNKDVFETAIAAAIAEATLIATKAAADPKRYIQPEIEAWRDRWVSTRYFDAKIRGRFDVLDEQAFTQVKADFPDATFVTLQAADFEAEATGNAEKSAAVFGHINWLNDKFAARRVDQMYDEYNRAFQLKATETATSVYEYLFMGALMGFYELYNTMLRKMEQGPKPAPVPGPGQHLVHTPFGDTIVNDVPIDDNLKVADLTVAQLRQIFREEAKA